MNTKLLLFLSALIFSTLFVKAQTSTKGFSFQGYAIDPDGKSIGSANITVQFSLISTSTTFTEEHNLTSDAFGVFHAIIGNSSVAKNAEFAKLDFTRKGDDYTLKVEVKKTVGGTYTIISNESMNAVPYARKAENGVPVGTVVAFAGLKTNIPTGWLACDGTILAQADYPQLYAVIAQGWGYSTVGTDFRVPDMRGMFLRGVDEGRAIDNDAAIRTAVYGGNSGNDVGSYQYEGYQYHAHNMQVDTDGPTGGGQRLKVLGSTGVTNDAPDTSIGVSGYSGGNETRPDNMAVYYIIKY